MELDNEIEIMQDITRNLKNIKIENLLNQIIKQKKKVIQ